MEVKFSTNLEALARLTGQSEQELTELLYESVEGEEPKLKEDADPFNLVLDAVKAKLAKAKDDRTDQYKRGLKEGALKVEKAIRAHGEFDDDLQGDTLVSALVDSLKATKAGDKPTDWKNDPKVKDWVNTEVQKRTDGFKSEWQKKNDELEAARLEIQQERHKEKVSKFAFDYLRGKNWNLSPNSDEAEVQRQSIEVQIPFDKTQFDDKGRAYIVDDEGNPKRDDFGNVEYLGAKLDKLGSVIGGFNVVDPKKSSPGAKSGGSAGDGGQSGLVISSDEQYQRLKSEAIKINSVADRMKRVAEIEKANAERRKAQS